MTAEHCSLISVAQKVKIELLEQTVNGPRLSSPITISTGQAALAFGISRENFGEIGKIGCLIITPIDRDTVMVGIERSVSGWRQKMWNLILDGVRARKEGVVLTGERRKQAYLKAAEEMQRNLGKVSSDASDDAQTMLRIMWEQLPSLMQSNLTNENKDPSGVRSAIGIAGSDA